MWDVGNDAYSALTGVVGDADSAPTGFEENQGTARLGKRLDRMEVAKQNLTQCVANLVELKQAAEAPGPMAQGCDPSRGQVNDCQSSNSGGLTHSIGIPARCNDLISVMT